MSAPTSSASEGFAALTPPQPGLFRGPWPAEDGGPRRTAAAALPALDATSLKLTAQRDAVGTTMVVLRAPGEVYALRHTLGRRPLEDPCVAWVERLHPETLETLQRSPDLPAGPFWPGGLACHANGSLIAVFGHHVHRLSPDLQVQAHAELPARRPYNSFVVLPDGTLVMKDFDRELREPTTLILLDPDTLERRAFDVPLGEPSIARLTADGDTVYVVGTRRVHRFTWTGLELIRDAEWGCEYPQPGGSYGWDPVVGGGQLWFLDNGDHDFSTTMRGAGVAPGPVHLWRLSLSDPQDVEHVEVCGLPHGAVTDPPLYDEDRQIALAYDSANGVVQAFRFDGGRLTKLWRRELNHSAHMILFAESGELVLHDFKGPKAMHTAAGRWLGRRTAWVLRYPQLWRAASGNSRDEVVVLDIATGAERARAAVPTPMQSVVFPAPGFARDIYWCTIATIARLEAR